MSTAPGRPVRSRSIRRRRGRSVALLVVTFALLAGPSCASDADDDRGGGRADGPGPSSTVAAAGSSEPSDPCGPVPHDAVPGGPAAASAGEEAVGSLDHLVPAPTRVVAGEGAFVIDGSIAVVVADPNAATAACLLRDELARTTGIAVPVRTDDGSTDDGSTGGPTDGERTVVFASAGPGPTVAAGASPTGAHHPEGYRVEVAPDRIDVAATTAAGHGWAVQTLLQAAPPEVHGPFRADEVLAIASGVVEDAPRYEWRGLMVDIARHFFGPADLRRVVDLMASYKLNVLHLHLTDDQGWRIEIDAYPALTEVGAVSEVGGGPGGFLTKDDYRDLVAYAARRGITVVPEIDLPGHTNAALVAVPELTCDGVAPEPYTGTSVGFSTLCLGTPAVDRFVREVLTEVAEMTPGPWIHVGGDESHATDPADYEVFVDETAQLVRSLGKVPMGWEEVGVAATGGDLVVQHWLDRDAAAAAARAGARVVLSPSPHLYFDMAYGPFAPAGNRWAGAIDTRKVYDWDPATYLAGVPVDRILGVEAPLWTELVETPDDIDRRLLPRLPALAELGWSAQADRRWDDLAARLVAHESRWTAAGRAHTPDPAIAWN